MKETQNTKDGQKIQKHVRGLGLYILGANHHSREPETAFTDGKCLGPDNITNEIFTKSAKATRTMYLTVFGYQNAKKYCISRVFPPKQRSLCQLETPMSLDISGSSVKHDNFTFDGLWWQISWFLASKDHQKPCYCLSSVTDFTSVKDDSRYLCHFSIHLFVHYTISLSSLCKLIWRHWTKKMPVRYILSSVWITLSIFSQLSIMQCKGCVF